MTRISRVVKQAAWPAVFILLIGYGLWLMRGGYLHYEGAFFLSAFLDDRSISAKILSGHINQWNCYQGRELSFLFGFIDAKVIALSARLNSTMFYSATNVVAFTATALLLWETLRRRVPKLSANQSGLIVSLMLTTPMFALSTYYYRTAKALTGLFLVLLADELSRVFVQNEGDTDKRFTSARPLRVFVFALLMAMSDRVGSAFIVLALGVVIVAARIGSRTRPAIISLVLALLAAFAFSVIGAKLSTMVDGFAPDTINQHILLRYTFADPHNYIAALGLWRDHVSYFFGNWGLIAPVAFLLVACIAAWRSSRATPEGSRKLRRDVVVAIGAAGILLLVYVVMYAKLTSITWPESRRVYYWIPMTVSIAIAAAIAAGRVVSAWPASSRLVTAALALMVCTNILALPGHRDIVARGEQHVAIEESPRVRDCMQSPEKTIAEFGLSAEGAQACGSVRIAAFGSIGRGDRPAPAVPNPLLYCRKTGQR